MKEKNEHTSLPLCASLTLGDTVICVFYFRRVAALGTEPYFTKEKARGMPVSVILVILLEN